MTDRVLLAFFLFMFGVFGGTLPLNVIDDILRFKLTYAIVPICTTVTVSLAAAVVSVGIYGKTLTSVALLAAYSLGFLATLLHWQWSLKRP